MSSEFLVLFRARRTGRARPMAQARWCNASIRQLVVGETGRKTILLLVTFVISIKKNDLQIVKEGP